MAYINKHEVLKAYKVLSDMHEEPDKQGATQDVSALRHVVALDRFFKTENRNCNTREREDKNKFPEFVGEVCSVCDRLYTTNFYYPLKEHNGDYSVGSNFYSAGKVSSSLESEKIYDYPNRKGGPIMKIRAGVLYRTPEFYDNINNYLKNEKRFNVAFVIWLLRNKSITIDESNKLGSLRNALLELYTNELVDTLLPENDEVTASLDDYSLNLDDNKVVLSDSDIRLLFANKPLQQITSSKYRPFVAAIKTKPFLLLAGISGTGKSKIVRDMAKACWGKDDPNRTAQEPDNFMMIPVRPNWHDSTELIGYVSNIPSPHYVVGPFLRAIVKAWELTAEYSEDGKTMPYFVCLDEMNLAPVEQYFAEYLSVIESRKGSGSGITTDVILKEAEDWYRNLCNKLTEESPLALREKIVKEGISLPPNLIVCGTVNMDETTYAFSRKVLDRAMTIEMNEVVLKAGLGEAKESFPQIDPKCFLPEIITPEDYYSKSDGQYVGAIEEVLEWLGKINEKLEGTPFKIAYRTRNEILLYVIHSEKLGGDRKDAFDEAVNMKILPRIEGDQKKVDTVLTELRQVLKEDVDIADENSSPSLKKLKVMDDRLKKQYYCAYWN